MTDALSPLDEHNRLLAQNVRPRDWKNPTPAGRHNLVVIGAGTAGLVTAAGAAGLGARVALVERNLMGGDCLNFGCVPSKSLISSARRVAQIRDAAAMGIDVPAGVKVDFPRVMERMRKLRAGISHHDSVQRFAKLGVEVFLGQASFSGPDTVEVGGQTLRFKKAVIATGARSVPPPIPGLDSVDYLTNETVFSLTELPHRLAVIGAGAIGCELAQCFQRFGSHVTLLETLPQILPREDADAAAIVADALRRDGVDIVTGSSINKISRDGSEYCLAVTTQEDDRLLKVDAILVGTGRRPSVTGLNLEAVGVEADPKIGVAVNDHLQTTNPRIFAAGDVASEFQFTHMADAMARIVIQNALFAGRKKVSALKIPRVTFTDPEVAHVGLYEEEALKQGIPVETFERSLEHVDRAILEGATEGFVRIHLRKGTDEILGATIVAGHAGDLISEIALAMTGGLGLGTVASTIHPYPTRAEAIKQTADAYNRTRLTPAIKLIFERYLVWGR